MGIEKVRSDVGSSAETLAPSHPFCVSILVALVFDLRTNDRDLIIRCRGLDSTLEQSHQRRKESSYSIGAVSAQPNPVSCQSLFDLPLLQEYYYLRLITQSGCYHGRT
jgi:hypothetical protein